MGAPVVRVPVALRAQFHAIQGGAGPLLTVREVAERLAVSTATVYALCERREIRHVRISNAIRIEPRELEAFIARRRVGTEEPAEPATHPAHVNRSAWPCHPADGGCPSHHWKNGNAMFSGASALNRIAVAIAIAAAFIAQDAEAVVLSRNTWLCADPAGTVCTWFKAGTDAQLRADGTVSSGTILNYSYLRMNSGQYPYTPTWFQAGTVTTFRIDGGVSSGTLKNLTYLAIDTSHSRYVWLEPSTVINTRPDASVSFGTLHDLTYLPIDRTPLRSVWFMSGTTFTTRNDGTVATGTIKDLNYLPVDTTQSRFVWFKALTILTTRDDGSVSSGTLHTLTYLPTNSTHTSWAWFSSGTVVTFRPDGSVIQ